MDFVQLNYFIVAAKCLSFTKAANLLYLTQPALSQQIIKMERELDLKLFTRDNRSLQLTPAGKILLKEFENIYLLYHNSLSLARNANNEMRGRLRIGILDGIEVASTLDRALKHMNEYYPEVEVALFSMCYDELAERLYDGRLDVAFNQKFDAEERSDLNFRIIEKTYDCIAISKSNPLSNKRNLSLVDLKNELFIVISETDHDISLRLILEECERNGFSLKYKPSPSFYANIQWLRAGLAVAIVDSNSVLKTEKDIKLVRINQFRDPSLSLVWYDHNTNPIRSLFTEIVFAGIEKGIEIPEK